MQIELSIEDVELIKQALDEKIAKETEIALDLNLPNITARKYRVCLLGIMRQADNQTL